MYILSFFCCIISLDKSSEVKRLFSRRPQWVKSSQWFWSGVSSQRPMIWTVCLLSLCLNFPSPFRTLISKSPQIPSFSQASVQPIFSYFYERSFKTALVDNHFVVFRSCPGLPWWQHPDSPSPFPAHHGSVYGSSGSSQRVGEEPAIKRQSRRADAAL